MSPADLNAWRGLFPILLLATDDEVTRFAEAVSKALGATPQN